MCIIVRRKYERMYRHIVHSLKEGISRIWCGMNTLGDTSAFVNPTVQLLLTRRGKIRMYGVGIVFEFYIAPLLF